MRSTGQAKAPDQKIRRSHDLPRLFSVILNPAHPAVQGQSIREVTRGNLPPADLVCASELVQPVPEPVLLMNFPGKPPELPALQPPCCKK
jgi:hypothetical protein